VKVLREFTFLESDKNPAKLQLGMSQYRVLTFQIVPEMSVLFIIKVRVGRTEKKNHEE